MRDVLWCWRPPVDPTVSYTAKGVVICWVLIQILACVSGPRWLLCPACQVLLGGHALPLMSAGNSHAPVLHSRGRP